MQPQGLFERTGNIWRAQGRRARLEFQHFRRHSLSHVLIHQEDVEGWREQAGRMRAMLKVYRPITLVWAIPFAAVLITLGLFAVTELQGDAGFVERLPEPDGLPDWLSQEELDFEPHPGAWGVKPRGERAP